MIKIAFLPSVVGVSQSHTLQQWSGNWTSLGATQIAVSIGGGKFSCGHNEEQAWCPFYAENKYINCLFFYELIIIKFSLSHSVL